MSIEAFINSAKALAKTKDKAGLQALLDKGEFLLRAKGKNGISAVDSLAMENEEDACDFLLANFANTSIGPNLFPSDFAYAAARAGHEALVNKYFAMDKSQFDVSKRLVAMNAAKGGYEALAQKFLAQIVEDSQRDYNAMACMAAMAGNEVLANKYADKLEPSERQYSEYAAHAACGGHEALADTYLALADESKRNYLRVATLAAQGGFEALADKYFNLRAAASAIEPWHYAWVAHCAIRGGHEALADKYLAKIDDPSKREYSVMATYAKEAGYVALAKKYDHLALVSVPAKDITSSFNKQRTDTGPATVAANQANNNNNNNTFKGTTYR